MGVSLRHAFSACKNVVSPRLTLEQDNRCSLAFAAAQDGTITDPRMPSSVVNTF